MPDPVQNALAEQPSNNLAYIGPTPRNRFMGGIADLLALGSSELTNLGIPGIKYLDEMSRSAGEGTRNFVVFPGEEKSMTILERNGQPAQMSVAEQIDNINEVLKKKRKK